jgi:hypothetical protein
MALYSIFSDGNTPNDFKAIVGGAVNDSFDLSYIEPIFDNTHEQRMEDWLGPDIYQALKEALAGTPTDDDTALLPYYRKPLAWLALHDYLPFAEAQISGAGVSRVETDSHRSAYKDQVRRIQAQCITNGHEAFERLLIFLEANKATYTGWPDAPGYIKYHGVMLNTALSFRSVYDKGISRQVFEESLFGCVMDAEALAIVKAIGDDQYAALLAARRDGAWTTEAKEKKAILLCQKVSAHFSLKEALARNYVCLEGNRVVQLEHSPDMVPNERTAIPLGVGVRSQLHDDRANAYLKSLCDYLDLNIDDNAFAHYKAYRAALAEAEAAGEEAPATNTLPSGANTGVSAGWDNVTGRKGIVRF